MMSELDAPLANKVLEWIKSMLVHVGRDDAANRINVVATAGDVSTILSERIQPSSEICPHRFNFHLAADDMSSYLHHFRQISAAAQI